MKRFTLLDQNLILFFSKKVNENNFYFVAFIYLYHKKEHTLFILDKNNMIVVINIF
jgi:hypothetical protein